MAISLKVHMLFAWILRLMLVIYGEWHDANIHLPYTDIDYKVFTDAARHISVGNSPYKRLTYRYPPILAALLLPNIWMHISFGKVLFCTVDVIAGGLGILLSGSIFPQTIELFIWLYNPLPAIISSRGNADALTTALVAWSLISVRKGNAIMSGVSLALASHLRLYPILFALPVWLSVTHQSSNKSLRPQIKKFNLWKWVRFVSSFILDRSRCLFTVSLIITFTFITAISYMLYGDEFLQESYFYHLRRMDTRHNFSVHFYLLYLTGSSWVSYLSFVPQLIASVAFGFKYGTLRSVPFACFCQAFVFVAFNKVMTAQYFLWPLSLLPAIMSVIGAKEAVLSNKEKGSESEHFRRKTVSIVERCVPNILESNSGDIFVNWKKLFAYVGLWVVSLGLWLLSAYLLEFRGVNTFLLIWLSGLLFFVANIIMLRKLIKTYDQNVQSEELTFKKYL